MARKTGKTGDYEVGYGKPPKHTQFQPDESGNLKGRPKGSKNVKTVVNERLHAKVEIKLNGKKKSVSTLEAIFTGLVADALKGNARARKELLELAKLYCADELQQAADDAIGPDDQAIVDDFIARHLRGAAAENDPAAEPGKHPPQPDPENVKEDDDDDAWLR